LVFLDQKALLKESISMASSGEGSPIGSPAAGSPVADVKIAVTPAPVASTISPIVHTTPSPTALPPVVEVAEALPGSVSGTLFLDTDGDGDGDEPLAGVSISLNDDSDENIATTTTNDQGEYTFNDVPPGTYSLRKTDDSTNDPIVIKIAEGENRGGNDFVDQPVPAPTPTPLTSAPSSPPSSLTGGTAAPASLVPGTISGKVMSRVIPGDDTGDQPLAGVVVALQDGDTGVQLEEDGTDESGIFEFFNVPPGKYKLVETNFDGYTDVSDSEGNPLDNTIALELADGTASLENTFIDAPPSKVGISTDSTVEDGNLYISGRVFADTNGDGVPDNGLPGVTVTLFDSHDDTLRTETTDDFGLFEFFNVPPAEYKIVQTNLPGYTEVSDSKGDPLDSTIAVDLTGGFSSYDNAFVDAPPSNVVSPTNPPDAPAYISGRVWVDTNSDGIGDKILPGVIVYLNDESGNTVATKSTDEQGLYEFFNVFPGKYQLVQIALPGYTDVADTEGDPTDSKISVSLATGQASYGNNFVDAPPPSLAPSASPFAPDNPVVLPGTISGKVFVRIPGVTGDQPLIGVVMSLQDESGVDLFDVGTDFDGYYEFLDVDPGTYKIVQTNFEGYTDVDDTEGNPIDGTITVTLGSGESSGDNNFIDAPAPGADPSLSATGAPGEDLYVAGRVWADINGNGVDEVVLPGVQVALNDSDGNNVAVETTDEQGLFQFSHLAPGKYTIVQTNLAGYTEVSDSEGDRFDSTIAVDLTDGKSSYDNEFVDAPPSNKEPPTNPPAASAYVSGRVWADTDGDGVGDAVLPGVIVYLKDKDGKVAFTESTDEHGLFEFFNIPAGKYNLMQTNLPGYFEVSDTEGDPLDSTIVVEISEGHPSYGNDFVDAPPPVPQSGTISGKVSVRVPGHVADLQPLVGVVVSLQSETGVNLQDVGTDENGDYEFVDVLPGIYKIVQTNLDGYTDVSDTTGDPLDGIISVQLKSGVSSYGNNFVDAPPAVYTAENPETVFPVSNITGIVWADTNGDGVGDQVLAGVQVSLVDDSKDTVYQVTTDDGGLFNFAVRIPSGKYQLVETNPPDYDDVSESTIDIDYVEGMSSADNTFVDAPEGSSNAIPLESISIETLPGTISGRVWLDSDGDGVGDSPLIGVKVDLNDEGGNNIFIESTDAEGKFDFLNVPPGNYEIVQTNFKGYNDVSDTGGNPLDNSISVQLSDGEYSANNTFVDKLDYSGESKGSGFVTLDSGGDDASGIISGTVLVDNDGDGVGDKPLGSVRVNLLNHRGEYVALVGTNEEGIFLFDNVPPGDYQLSQVNLPGYDSVSKNLIYVTLLDGQSSVKNAFIDSPPGGFVTVSPNFVAPSNPLVTSSPVGVTASGTSAGLNDSGMGGLSGGAITGVVVVVSMLLILVGLFVRRRRRMRPYGYPSGDSSVSSNIAARAYRFT
jgi:uncharacterized surface anchored protein